MKKKKKEKEAVYKHDVARNPGAHWVAYRVSLAGPCYSPVFHNPRSPRSGTRRKEDKGSLDLVR